MGIGIQVGSLVACVKDDWYPQPSMVPPGVAFPVKGCVYTVAEILEASAFFVSGTHVYLRLVEVRNPVVTYQTYKGEPMWNINSFRPVKKTDISVFRSEVELV